MESMRGNDEQRLDALFRAYRNACPNPEASANFMPNLWQRIEARQTYTFSFRRMANAFVTAALALSLGLGVYMSIPAPTRTLPKVISRLWRKPIPWMRPISLVRSTWS